MVWRLVLIFASLVQLAAVPPPTIEVNNGLLSVQARNVPLWTVIDRIANQAKFSTRVLDSAGAISATPVDVDFSDVPLEQGLATLLRGWNHALVIDPRTRAPLKLLILGRKNESAGSAARTPKLSVQANEVRPDKTPEVLPAQLSDAERAMALADAAQIKLLAEAAERTAEPVTLETIQRDLSSTQAARRIDALAKLGSVPASDSSIEQLRRLAESDPAPEVRVAALDEMVRMDTSEASMAVLQRIAAKGSGPARDLATEVLANLASDTEASSGPKSK